MTKRVNVIILYTLIFAVVIMISILYLTLNGNSGKEAPLIKTHGSPLELMGRNSHSQSELVIVNTPKTKQEKVTPTKVSNKAQLQATELTIKNRVQVYIPPISYRTTEPVRFQGELEDLDAYKTFELNQSDALKLNFIKSSKIKVEQLNTLLLKGESSGLPEEQLQFARDKINGIKTLVLSLEQELNQK